MSNYKIAKLQADLEGLALKTQAIQKDYNPFDVFTSEEHKAAIVFLEWVVKGEPQAGAPEPTQADVWAYVHRLHEWVKALEPACCAALAEVYDIHEEWKSYGYFRDGLLEYCTTKDETFKALLEAAIERTRDEKTKSI